MVRSLTFLFAFLTNLYFLQKIFYLFIFRERGRERERGEKHQCVVASWAPPTGDLAHNPGMCPDWELNRQLFGLQACAQSAEVHQPGQTNLYFLIDLQSTCIVAIVKSNFYFKKIKSVNFANFQMYFIWLMKYNYMVIKWYM